MNDLISWIPVVLTIGGLILGLLGAFWYRAARLMYFFDIDAKPDVGLKVALAGLLACLAGVGLISLRGETARPSLAEPGARATHGTPLPQPPRQVRVTRQTPPQPQPLPLGVQPSKLTARDFEAGPFRGYPAHLRQGLSSEQLMQKLNYQAWAFEFAGGPVHYWLELAEVGQHTMPARCPSEAEKMWSYDVASGRLVFALGPDFSPKPRRFLPWSGMELPQPESIRFCFCCMLPGRVHSHDFSCYNNASPLWFGWKRKTLTVTVLESRSEPAKNGAEVTLVRVEGTEQPSDNRDEPRKATLVLKAMLGKSAKP